MFRQCHTGRDRQKSYNDKRKTAEDGQPEPEAEKPKEKTKKAKPEETASQALDTSALLKKKKSGIIPFKRKQESLCNQTAIYEKRYGVSIIKLSGIQILREVTGLQTMCYPSIMCRRSFAAPSHVRVTVDAKAAAFPEYAMKNTQTRTALADELLRTFAAQINHFTFKAKDRARAA